jgi:TorA maturation chaperone TorD
VALELEFMYFLAFRELIDEELVWAERQRRFWCSHLGQWLPDLARNMSAAGCHPFYDELASLLVSFCETETVRFQLTCTSATSAPE